MVFPGSFGLKVSSAKEELVGREKAPAHYPRPWMGFWDNASYSVIVIIPRFGKSKPPEMRQILLHIRIRNSPSLVGWRLCSVEKSSQQMFKPQPRGRSQVFSEIMACDNKSLRPTAIVSSSAHGHSETLAHWALISPGPPVGLAPSAHTGAASVPLLTSVHFCSLPASLHVLWAWACGLPIYALEQLEFPVSMVMLKNLFHILYFTKVIWPHNKMFWKIETRWNYSKSHYYKHCRHFFWEYFLS